MKYFKRFWEYILFRNICTVFDWIMSLCILGDRRNWSSRAGEKNVKEWSIVFCEVVWKKRWRFVNFLFFNVSSGIDNTVLWWKDHIIFFDRLLLLLFVGVSCFLLLIDCLCLRRILRVTHIYFRSSDTDYDSYWINLRENHFWLDTIKSVHDL